MPRGRRWDNGKDVRIAAGSRRLNLSVEHPVPGAAGYRWVMLAAMCGVYFAFGVVTLAIPPMIDDVRADLDLSRAAIGAALGAWPLMYIVTAPVAGKLIDRIGLQRAVTIGIALITVSALIQAVAQNLATLWLAIAVVGLGGPFISASPATLVSTWFVDPRQRPLTVGLYTSAPALGGVFALALTNTVLLPVLGNWRWVLVAESLICAVAALTWLAVNRAAPPAPVSVVHTASTPGSTAIRPLLASRGVRLALVLGIGSFFVNQGLAAWLPNILEVDSGFSARTASNVAAASLAIGIVARLTLPGFADAGRRALLLNAVMGVMAVSLVAMAVGPVAVTVIAALVLGIRAALNSLVIVGLIEADGVSHANMGTASGLWFAFVEIGGASGPFVVGALGDSSSGFDGALLVLTVVLVALIVVNATRTPRSRRQPVRDPRTSTSDPVLPAS